MLASEISKRLQEIAINLDGFAFDPRSGESYRLNESGLRIFKYLRAGLTLEKATQELSKEYSIPYEVAYEDIEDFVLQLRLQGLTD